MVLFFRTYQQVLQRAEDKRFGEPTAKKITKTTLCATYITGYMSSLNPIANAYGTTSGNKQVKELPFRGRTDFYREYKMKCLTEGYLEVNIPSKNVFKRAYNGVLNNNKVPLNSDFCDAKVRHYQL